MQGKTRILYYLVVLGVAALGAYLLSAGLAKREVKPAAKPEAPQAQPKKGKPDPPRKAEVLSRAERGARARRRLKRQQTTRIGTDLYTAVVSNLNTGLTSFQLKGDRYRNKDRTPIEIITTDKEAYFPLGMELEDSQTGKRAIRKDALWDFESSSKRAVRARWRGDGLAIVRKFEVGKGPYQLWVTTSIANRGHATRRLIHKMSTHHYVEHKTEKAAIPFLPVRSPSVSNGLCHLAPREKGGSSKAELTYETERHPRKDLLEPKTFNGTISFAGVENVYFLSVVAPHPNPNQPGPAECRLVSSERGMDASGESLGSLFSTQLIYPELKLDPGQSHTYRALAYLGPKMPEELAKAGHALPKAVDMGFFSVLSEALVWLLRTINKGVGNWGVAIILLTLVVKIVLYPLTAKSFQSMARMRMLKPEMDQINEMYKDDREKKGAATMELYRKHKINPLGGCLPQLLQLPVWIALYTSLSTNVELFHAPFALWWTDLSSPDPFFVLPVALGGLMFLQQKMTPATLDAMQAKMMLYVMPIMITSFMLFLPAGLCLYMFTNSALSIGQQRLIERRLGQASAAQATPSATNAETPRVTPTDALSNGEVKKVVSMKKSKPSKSQRRSRRGRKKATA